MVAELPAQQTFLLVTSAQANAALGVAPLAGVDPCTTGGGSLVFKYAPDAAKNAAKKVEAIAEANGDLKYIVPPEFQNADTNKLVIFYKVRPAPRLLVRPLACLCGCWACCACVRVRVLGLLAPELPALRGGFEPRGAAPSPARAHSANPPLPLLPPLPPVRTCAGNPP